MIAVAAPVAPVAPGAPPAGVLRADPRLALRAPPPLAAFNELLVLTAADVHVAVRLVARSAGDDDAVLLATALAVRALRLGHVCVDLLDVHQTATTDSETRVDLSHLPWPDPGSWRDRVAASPLVADGDDGPSGRPLRLVGSRLYLDRYWRQECAVAADLTARSLRPVPDIDPDLLRRGLARLWPDADPEGSDLPRLAGAAAVLLGFVVVAGGPGTGKTTTVARILALLAEQHAATGAGPPLRIALSAPTGKAAARLEEAVLEEAGRLPVPPEVRAQLLTLRASTLHRLLGRKPGSESRFVHDGAHPLPHDVVIVDEASMVALSLMAKLVDAVRPDARLILVGDPRQLASVEAGAVLGDIVGPALDGLRIRPGPRAGLAQATGQAVPATDPPTGTAIGDGIIVLRRVHRYGGDIARLAEAIQAGDGDAAMAVLGSAGGEVTWIPVDDTDRMATAPGLGAVRDRVVTAGRSLIEAARAGEGAEALEALTAVRVLCAHRQGSAGVSVWTGHIERWLRAAIDGYNPSDPWYVGRPVLVTANDYEHKLYNGDTGVVVRGDDGEPVVVFDLQGQLERFSPYQLGHIQTLHAMTVHKSQGSQFGAVVVVLPDASSRILTRELLYTAVTRAQRDLILVGTEASVRAAIDRPIARATGLRQRLWH
jgi:exodeoxyribonuclease V alpha subunit